MDIGIDLHFRVDMTCRLFDREKCAESRSSGKIWDSAHVEISSPRSESHLSTPQYTGSSLLESQ